MIVYSDRRQKRELRLWPAEVARLSAGARHHSAIRDTIVEYDRFEVALTDALCPDADGLDPIVAKAGDAAVALGRAFAESWLRGAAAARPWLALFGAELCKVGGLLLPEAGWQSVAEGYAYYALYPECYAAAAAAAWRAERPRRAVAIGLRGIGASLSAVVAGTLEAQGCPVARFTLRPRGHPFARRPVVSAALRQALIDAAPGALVLIVDEGPGLSGSSLTGTAEFLSELGIPDKRIVFLPSWAPSGADFVSEPARARWTRHRKYVATFENVWPARRLGPPDAVRDISGGGWRRLILPGGAWPAVQPQHERRKYLRRDPEPVLLKFAGLGSEARRKVAMAGKLANAGWSPRPGDLADGFLAQEWVDGRPLHRADGRAVAPYLADYVAFRRAAFPLNQRAQVDDLFAMAGQALEETFGAGSARPLARIDRSVLEHAPAIATDNRMLPHEWLAVGDRFLKTDAVDHHDDHFFPGPQDAAWDLAGAVVEFGLDGGAAAALAERYAAKSGDREINRRLPFYRLAYAAWRLGYAQLAAQSLAGSADGTRFRRDARRYRDLMASAWEALR